MLKIIDVPKTGEHFKYLLPWAASLLFRSDPLTDRRPWLPFAARDEIAPRLGPGAKVFEYGSGGSTLWFADLGCQVVTVEHDARWCERVYGCLRAGERNRVDLIVASPEPREPDDPECQPEAFGCGDAPFAGLSFRRYVTAIDSYDDACFDVVLVDGRARAACMRQSWPKVRRGGLLVLDDSERPRYDRAIASMPTVGRYDCFGPTAYTRWFRRTTLWEKRG